MEHKTQNTALLVMDMQMGILGNLPDSTKLVDNVAKVIATAREKKIPVMYVVVGFRAGMPEISMDNKGFAGRKDSFANISMDEFMKVHADIAPLGDEITIVKRRVSAFTGSDLEVVLRAQGIRHIILTGIATSGVVLSTTREAADKDFRITILSNACADMDQEVHDILTTKIFPRQAEVVTVEEWNNL